jgi:DNA segregation ATPase FtsK/SpoIIIE, S-DNA-T family
MSEKIKNKQTKKSKNPGIITRIKTFFEFTQDQRFQNIFGLACFLSSIYITIAFISFFFTWKADQSEISKGMWEFFTNNDIAVENWLKKLGAVVSHLFIYSWFGVASFIFPFLIFLVGFRLFFKVSLLNLRKTLKHSLFFLIWISITLAFFSSPEENSNEEAPLLILGGTAGYFMQLAIISFIGKIGTLLLILFSLGVYIIVTFNPPVEILLKLLSKKEEQYAPEIQKSKTTEEMFDSPLLNKLKNEQKEKPMVFDFSGENENKKIIDTPEEELKPDSATELPLSNETSEEIKKEGEPEFSIEKTESKETILTDEEIENKTHDIGEYDPTLDLSTFQLPGIELLKEYGDGT